MPVYQAAEGFLVAVDELVEQLPSYRRYLGQQLRRAVLSITLNIAEGAQELPCKEKARFYRIAERSAAESDAALRAIALLEPHLARHTPPLRCQAFDIAAELAKLGRTVYRRGRRGG